MNENGINNYQQCDNHEKRISDLEEDCDIMNDKIIQMDKEIAVTTTSILQTLKGLEKLPDTLDSIKNVMSLMQISIGKTEEKTEALSCQVESIKDKVNQIDDDTKFNILKFLKNNWVAILAALYILIDSSKSFIK